jgi:hypothetical protein
MQPRIQSFWLGCGPPPTHNAGVIPVLLHFVLEEIVIPRIRIKLCPLV